MKKKNFMCIALSALIVSLCACGNAQPASTSATESTAAETTAVTTTAAEKTTTTTTTTAAETEAAEAPALFEALNGTYDELFTVICAPEHDQIWLDKCTALVGEENAEGAAQMLKSACTGTLWGEEAVKAYSDGNKDVQFDCYFINGISKFTFDGNKISGTDANGSKVFEHTYTDAGEFSIGGIMNGELYETSDSDAGEFRYFLMMPDTPAETYHIEFRYGNDKEALAQYSEGKYAYWLASGILENCDDTMIDNVIGLFCEENLGGKTQAVEFAGGTGTTEDPYIIETAEQLAGISANFAASYRLDADIDLKDVQWQPIGAFTPMGTEGEEAETPNSDYAFTGIFNGNGHKISNLKIDAPSGFTVGLFGCVSNAKIYDLTVENADINGAMMTGAVVGYAFASEITNVTLSGNNTVRGNSMDYNGTPAKADMVGGIVGAGMDSVIRDCTASADIIIPDGGSNAGIVGGGLEVTNVIGCKASGAITAGDNCMGLGGVAGCGFGSETISGNTAEDVTITSGANAYLVGGVIGYAGGYEDAKYGVTVTAITDCTSKNTKLDLGDGAKAVGGIIGGGFYSEIAAAYGAPYDSPAVFTISGSTNGTDYNGNSVDDIGA